LILFLTGEAAGSTSFLVFSLRVENESPVSELSNCFIRSKSLKIKSDLVRTPKTGFNGINYLMILRVILYFLYKDR